MARQLPLHAAVSNLKIQRTVARTVVLTISGSLDTENVAELCQLIDAEPLGAIVTLDLTDLVLAHCDAVRLLRDGEIGQRVLLRNCPAYIRAWLAVEED
jgi:anti-anti-sigma regulatory factor